LTITRNEEEEEEVAAPIVKVKTQLNLPQFYSNPETDSLSNDKMINAKQWKHSRRMVIQVSGGGACTKWMIKGNQSCVEHDAA